jgi:hypothetical protein
MMLAVTAKLTRFTTMVVGQNPFIEIDESKVYSYKILSYSSFTMGAKIINFLYGIYEISKRHFLLLLILFSLTISSNVISTFILIILSYLTHVLLQYVFIFISKVYNKYILNPLKHILALFLNYTPFKPVHNLIYLYMTYLFNLRYYFTNEHPWIIHSYFLLLPLIFFLNHFLYTQFIVFCLTLGIYFISTDNLGALFSSYLLTTMTSTFSQGYTHFLNTHLQSKHMIIRKVSGFARIGSMIIGSTKMSSTGRASLGVAFVSGSAYLVNEQLNRMSTERIEATKVAVQLEGIAATDRATTLRREQFEYQKAQDARKGSWPWNRK